ncbi:glycosyltransferase [Patescibacteria group bacterium]|nr:glycosyltransferase [Patescibacteria group bacterium]
MKIQGKIYRAKKASVFVAPTFSGSGLRIKIPHALAAGIPVVTTKFGVEGLLEKEKSGVLIANDETAFANGVIELILNRKKAKKLSEQGTLYIEKNYSEKAALKVFNSVL